MNEWLVKYVYEGSHEVTIYADTIYMAIDRFREIYSKVPSLAVYSINCIK